MSRGGLQSGVFRIAPQKENNDDHRKHQRQRRVQPMIFKRADGTFVVLKSSGLKFRGAAGAAVCALKNQSFR